MLRLLQPVEAIGGFCNDLNQVLWPSLAPDLFGEAGADGFLGSGTGLDIEVEEAATVHIFSGGAASADVGPVTRGRRLWCVRGPLTAQCLAAEPNAAITDGVLLAQSLVPAGKPPVGSRSIGVMPRYDSLLHPGWVEACDLAQLELVSPVGPPLDIVDQVRSLELLLTESLHGAVLADTFGVPWLAFATTASFNRFKWLDWALSFPLSLQVTAVPPPNARPLLLEGRPRLGWSRSEILDTEAAFVRPSSTARRRDVAARIASSPLWTEAVRRRWKLSPARTAAALLETSRLDATVSPHHRRRSLAAAMMDRLDTLCRLNGTRLRA